MGPMTMMDTILARASVRSFTGDPVPQDKLDKLLEAAMAAPSARNRQPWHFIIVEDRRKLELLQQGLPHCKMLVQAGLGVIVCGDNQEKYWVEDCCAATENLLLAAHAQGLGAVWTAVHPAEEKINVVRETLELPDHVTPLNVIPVGVPAQKPEVKQKHDAERIHLDSW
ncbi:nitroreductase family protein [Candidatus Woesearchaeota archaeon]|nr:nitroreductase family protein [Candidatus Woesearchaeota archaeon]